MAGAALLAFLPRANRAVGDILELFGDGMREARTAAGAVISLAAGVLLFALQTPIRFIGDSDLRLGLLTSGLETDRLFPQSPEKSPPAGASPGETQSAGHARRRSV